MNKFAPVIFSTIALFVSPSAVAQPCYQTHIDVPVITNQTYHEARQALLDSGWQPVRTIHYNDADNFDIRYGNGKILWDKGYTELETCAGTGTAPCRFGFKDIYGNKLIVVTEGEEYPEVGSYALVSRYWLESE